MKKHSWSVGVIQKKDGHEFDGIFITNSHETLRKFATFLRPLQVLYCRHENEKEANEFFFSISDGYVNIDPLNYIHKKLMEKYIAEGIFSESVK